MSTSIEQRTVPTATIEHGVLEAGPPDGPLALLLHGFPDTARTWRHLLPALAGDGYHAVAPFVRGFHPSAVPTDGCYQLGALVADVTALHEALGGDERAVLVSEMLAYRMGIVNEYDLQQLIGKPLRLEIAGQKAQTDAGLWSMGR